MIQQLIDFKNLVDTSITTKELPGSILKTDVGGRLKDLADLLQWVIDAYNGPDSKLFQADGFYIPENGRVIEFISILPTAPVILRIGTTAGGEDIQPDEQLEANKLAFATIYSDKKIYFTGITADTTIKFYQR